MVEPPHHVGAFSPEMALLGLLYAGPGYGYDLHRKIAADLGYVWHLSQSQAYAILKRLEKNGDITSRQVTQERLPPRQLLSLTQFGEKRFLSWVDSPSSGSIRAIRLEFITRVYFASLYFPAKLPNLFARQREDTLFHIQRLENIIADRLTDRLYDRMSLTLRLFHLRDVLAWLDVYEPEILTK